MRAVSGRMIDDSIRRNAVLLKTRPNRTDTLPKNFAGARTTRRRAYCLGYRKLGFGAPQKSFPPGNREHGGIRDRIGDCEHQRNIQISGNRGKRRLIVEARAPVTRRRHIPLTRNTTLRIQKIDHKTLIQRARRTRNRRLLRINQADERRQKRSPAHKPDESPEKNQPKKIPLHHILKQCPHIEYTRKNKYSILPGWRSTSPSNELGPANPDKQKENKTHTKMPGWMRPCRPPLRSQSFTPGWRSTSPSNGLGPANPEKQKENKTHTKMPGWRSSDQRASLEKSPFLQKKKGALPPKKLSPKKVTRRLIRAETVRFRALTLESLSAARRAWVQIPTPAQPFSLFQTLSSWLLFPVKV